MVPAPANHSRSSSASTAHSRAAPHPTGNASLKRKLPNGTGSSALAVRPCLQAAPPPQTNVIDLSSDPGEGGGAAGPVAKKKKPNGPGAGQIYSQPKDTGVGQVIQTRLIYALSFLKDQAHPIRLEDLAYQSKVEDLLHNEALYNAFKEHERVRHHETTGLWSYKPDYDIPNATGLLHLLRTRVETHGGMSVKTLRDSCQHVTSYIEELEKDGKVIVLRSGAPKNQDKDKDKEKAKEGETNGGGGGGQMKMVFLNEIAKNEEGQIEQEFKDRWNELTTPGPIDLPRELEAEGDLNPESIQTYKPPTHAKRPGKKNQKRKIYNPNRRVRIVNTHLKGVDLTKDFVPNSGGKR